MIEPLGERVIGRSNKLPLPLLHPMTRWPDHPILTAVLLVCGLCGTGAACAESVPAPLTPPSPQGGAGVPNPMTPPVGGEGRARGPAATTIEALLKEYDALPPEERAPEKANALAAKLAQKGSSAAPALVQTLKDGGTGVPGGGPARSRPSLSVVIRVLTALKAAESVPPLLEIAQRSSDHPLRQAALQALGKLGEAALIPVLLPLLNLPDAAGTDSRSRQPSGLVSVPASFEQEQTCEAAAQTLAALARKPGGPPAIRAHLPSVLAKAGEMFKIRITDVLRDAECREAREILVSLLLSEMSINVRAAVIRAIGYTNSPPILDILMSQLANEDDLKKEAILALGRARYVPALPLLAGLLESEDPGVKGNAQWALRNTTGRTFNSAERATQWLQAEEEENDKQCDAWAGKLETAAPELLPLIIERMGDLIFAREKVEEAVLPYADHEDFRVRAAACAVLGKTQNLALLVEKLRDSSKEVAYSAWRALKDATGRDLPPDHTQWHDWLER